MADVLKIGNAQGFWGDSSDAPANLVAQAPDLDWLTLDYLAEVSMSILARQREKDSSLGYAGDFLDVIRSLAPTWRGGRPLRLVANAGGLNPRGCAEACVAILREARCNGLKIGVVSGDDVLSLVRNEPAPAPLITANAYLGAAPIVEAIRQDADIIITGRVADPSLTVAPCIAHFNWRDDEYDKLAGATVAGHLIECGTQVTGGISTDWMNIPEPANIGFPIVEVREDGSCTVTKPAGTGGRVDGHVVKEQLLYEIGDPANYLSPDVTVSFLTLRVKDLGGDRVQVSGATGRPPPSSYKVSGTYRAGFRASGMLTMNGHDAVAKARRAGQIVLERLRRTGAEPGRSLVECLGSGDVVPVGARRDDLLETVLRITVADERREVVERFTKEIVPLVTSGPQGTTGYFDGRPAVREVFGYWPSLIERNRVRPAVEILEV
ncbi:MAG TPA: acyclic terpene utilization AtuA family protein [Tepidisphaeraceae bacterium]|jgi:hypothetical protein